MNFDRDWTPFALDAEIGHYGTSRVCAEHNKTRRDLAQAQAELAKQSELVQREWLSPVEAEGLRRELAAVKAERDSMRADAERLDWLEELTKRLATWNGASGLVEKWLETDMCIRGPNVNIYIRNEYGQHIRGGTGSCVRLAIDSAREQQPEGRGE